MTRQRGFVLLPVTLALGIVAALAYSMTRDGAMTVTAVDAQYDIDSARYLAEGGVSLLKWRNDMAACGNVVGFTGPVTALAGGTITASGLSYAKKTGLALTVTATTARGTVSQIVLDAAHGLPVYDLTNKIEVTFAAQGGGDTYLSSANPLVPANSTYLETTDGSANGLIKFGLPSVPATALITEATLRLYLASVQSTQPGTLGIYRMVRTWPFPLMSWSNGWTNPGGDFVAQPSATMTNVLATSTWYTARIDGLVQGWVSSPANNLGAALKPTGLITARFNSFEASTNPAQLFVRYYKLCS